MTSINDFSWEVDLECSRFPCTFSPSSVTPPANGQVTTVMTLSVVSGYLPGNYVEEVVASWNGALRIVEVDVEVSEADLIFVDGFESGSTSAWN